MSMLTEAARAKLAQLGKVDLGFYPTRLHRLDRLSEALGVDLWIKREDLSGISLFGGNKVRKLQYLMKDALAKGCDTVYTYGATQSNHAMQTAAAARCCGLTPELWLEAVVEPKPGDVRANLLLDTILGAKIHIVPAGLSPEELRARTAQRTAELEAEGHRVYDIPVGGSTPLGAAGFAECYVEIKEQTEALGLSPAFVCTATGSGGTLAGLAAGRTMIGDTDTAIRAYTADVKDEAAYPVSIVDKANALLDLIGERARVRADDFRIEYRYFLPGYEKPNPEANDDIRLMARTEGLFLDPVYSGKAFHGMCDEIRRGVIAKGSTVVFLHTGGATALFSEPEIIGDLAAE